MTDASMILINGETRKEVNYEKTFKLIPTRIDCPYNEAIYDVEKQVLFIISKEKKLNVHQVDTEQTVFYEYIISTRDEIIDFVNRFSVNKGEFDFLKYMKN